MRRHRERELERRSDELIIADRQDRPDEEYPCHTERWMDILGRRERPGVERSAASGGEIEATLARMVVDATLTRRQRSVIRLLTRGLSQRQIAEQLGLSESQVSRIRGAALDRMRREGVLR